MRKEAKAAIATIPFLAAGAAYSANKGGPFKEEFLDIHDRIIIPAQDITLQLASLTPYPATELLVMGAATLGVAGVGVAVRKLCKSGLKESVKSVASKWRRYVTITAMTACLAYTGWVSSFTINNQRETRLDKIVKETVISDDDKRSKINSYRSQLNHISRQLETVTNKEVVTVQHLWPPVKQAAQEVIEELLNENVSIPNVKQSHVNGGTFAPKSGTSDWYNIIVGEPIVNPSSDKNRIAGYAHELTHRYFADEFEATMVTDMILRRAIKNSKNPHLLKIYCDILNWDLTRRVSSDKKNNYVIKNPDHRNLWAKYKDKTYQHALIMRLENLPKSEEGNLKIYLGGHNLYLDDVRNRAITLNANKKYSPTIESTYPSSALITIKAYNMTNRECQQVGIAIDNKFIHLEPFSIKKNTFYQMYIELFTLDGTRKSKTFIVSSIK